MAQTKKQNFPVASNADEKALSWPSNRKIYPCDREVVDVPSRLQLPICVNRVKGTQINILQLFNCARHDYTYK